MDALYEVAVDAPLATTLTYCQPVGSTEAGRIPAGCCVRVPLGGRLAIGYVLGPAEAPSKGEASFVVKPIAEVLSEAPIFPPSLIAFYRWIANYYLHPIGEVLRTALPLAPTSRRHRQLKPKTRPILLPGPLLMPLLEAQPRFDVDELVVLIRTSLQISLKKSERKVLEFFCGDLIRGNYQPVPRALLLERYPGAGSKLPHLQQLGIIEPASQQLFRDPFGGSMEVQTTPEHLTAEQQQVLDILLPAVDAHAFAPFLLFGVTGCGKTEVYLRGVQHALAADKTALVLVPEIALASQLEAHFHARFGSRLALLHSGLSDGERFDQWQKVLSGEARVVLGARSAVFAPLAHLGIVIVDEEHEPAYKQEDGLRYNGRDLAVLRAQMSGCPVVLGSATPSVVSYHHCMQGKYRLLTMHKRVAEQPLPTVEIVDLATIRRSRPDLAFSDQLISAMAETLEQGRQSLLFVNRRGFSSYMACRDCGAILQCKHCLVSLTLHRGQHTLLCHYCGFRQHPATLCPACGSARVSGGGIGSERIEEEVRQLFPEARVARLDSDTTGNRKHYQATLRAVRSGQIDILVGTQMIAKGLHFPRITLVGVVWADTGLGMPDYKAAERTFALLSQVTGRAGRGGDPGRVIIQTYQPRHYSVALARQHDYRGFYGQEISVRQPLSYPPFSRLVIIRFSGRKEERVEQAAVQVGRFLRDHPLVNKSDILGPTPSPLGKLKDKVRWQLMIKSRSPAILHALCEAVRAKQKKLCPHDVSLGFDVDPENMM
ncbi:MAG: primosomal protein N' [Proteobacteria bacterium]|nr:primosomal protein N' [Pseudomonadota bacterium]